MWPLPAAESVLNPDPGWASCQLPPSEQGAVRVWGGRNLRNLSVTSFERGSQCSNKFWRSIGGVMVGNRLTMSQTTGKASSLPGCVRKSVASSLREVILSARIWWDIWSVGFSSVHLGTRETQTYWSWSSRRPWWRSGASVVQGEAERWPAQPGEGSGGILEHL